MISNITATLNNLSYPIKLQGASKMTTKLYMMTRSVSVDGDYNCATRLKVLLLQSYLISGKARETCKSGKVLLNKQPILWSSVELGRLN